MGKDMKDFLDNPVYIVTCYRGENASDVNEDIGSDDYIGFKDRIIISVHQRKERAIRLKEYFQEKADKNGFGDYHKYCVESHCVFE